MNEEKTKKKKSKFKIILIILAIILLAFVIFYFIKGKSSENKQNINQVILENPMKKIVQESVNKDGTTTETIIQQGIKEFNQDYINYILLSLGVGELHSFVGFGNPVVEMNLDGEIWSSEIINRGLGTIKNNNNDKDLIILVSKEEAVKALLSPNIAEFMKASVVSGRTQLEMTAGKPELLAKGYLEMYNKLKG